MRLGLLILVAFLFAPDLHSQGTTVVTGGTLVDVQNGTELKHFVIVIVGDRISRIGKSGEIQIPDGAKVIDASGRWIVPGFIDMHAHPSWHEGLPFEMYLARGITTIRDPAGDVTLSRLLREKLDSGKQIGPRYYFSGQLLDGLPPVWPNGTILVDTPQRAAGAVNFLIDQGVDFIKTYNNVKEPEFVEILKTAHARGMRVAGHVPRTMTMTHAVELGLDILEHVRITGRELLTKEEADQLDFLPYGKREVLLWQRFDLKSEKMKRLVALLAEKKVFMDVTLIADYGLVGVEEQDRNDPNNKYLPKEMLESWLQTPHPEIFKVPTELKAASAESFKKRQQFVGLCIQAGVRIVTGTDGPGLGSLLPGFALHREFKLLSEAGMSPIDVLRATTLVSAQALGKEKDLGTLEEGKYADFVILQKDPLASVDNLDTITMVFKAGQSFDPQKLLAHQPTN